jgi:hypothetical protein
LRLYSYFLLLTSDFWPLTSDFRLLSLSLRSHETSDFWLQISNFQSPKTLLLIPSFHHSIIQIFNHSILPPFQSQFPNWLHKGDASIASLLLLLLRTSYFLLLTSYFLLLTSDLPSVIFPAKVGGASCFAPVRISPASWERSDNEGFRIADFGFRISDFGFWIEDWGRRAAPFYGKFCHEVTDKESM